MLTSNTCLPSALAMLPKLTTALADLSTAINAVNPNTVTIKVKAVQLEKVFYAMKEQVELDCNDNEDYAVSSGFDLSHPKLNKPKVFSVTQVSQSGSVDLQCVYAKGAAYIWEQISDPINANTWGQIGVTNSKGLSVIGLKAGNKYWFRARAVVKDILQTYSDPQYDTCDLGLNVCGNKKERNFFRSFLN
jgi:predicted phage tail protein